MLSSCPVIYLEVDVKLLNIYANAFMKYGLPNVLLVYFDTKLTVFTLKMLGISNFLKGLLVHYYC
jgi:hypothetical protein